MRDRRPEDTWFIALGGAFVGFALGIILHFFVLYLGK